MHSISKRWFLYLLFVLRWLCSIWLKYCVPKAKAFDAKETKLAIPEAKGLPLIGTLVDLIRAGGAAQLHKYIDNRHRKLGAIFRERLGGGSAAYVFVSSASLMRTVFLFEGQYPRHPLPEAWTLYNREFKCQRGLFFMEDAEWLHNRRLLNRFLLNGKLDWIEAPITASTERLVAQWQELANSENNGSGYEIHNLEQSLYRWAVDVICGIMFGQNIVIHAELEILLNSFSEVVHEVFKTSAALMDVPPKLAKLLHLRCWRNFKQSVSSVLELAEEIIDLFVTISERQKMKESLVAADTETLYTRLTNAEVTPQMIKRIFVDLVIAAGDTTAYSTAWALYLLSQSASLQQRLAQDVLLHKHRSPLINGFIKETLRLYPVAPFIGRYLSTDAVLEGYHIKKDTLVLLSLYTAGRDGKHFPHPYVVKPERWLRNEISGVLTGVLQAHGSLPFAIGNRACIGRKIATTQMAILLAMFVGNFQVSCLNAEPIEPILRMVTVPNQAIQLLLKYRQQTN